MQAETAEKGKALEQTERALRSSQAELRISKEALAEKTNRWVELQLSLLKADWVVFCS